MTQPQPCCYTKEVKEAAAATKNRRSIARAQNLNLTLKRIN